MPRPARRRTLLLLAAILAGGTPAVAQLRVEVQGGMALSRLADGTVEGTSYRQFRAGIIAGAVGRYPLSRRFSVRPEVSFAQLGGKTSSPSGDTASYFRLDYVTIPLLLQYNVPTPEGARAVPYLYAGPELDYRLSCRFQPFSGARTADCAGNGLDSPGTTLDVLFGVGADAGRFSFGARYVNGLTRMDRKDGMFSPKLRTITFLLGYRVH